MNKMMTVVMATLVLAAGMAWANDPPKMKMTTEIPPGITTPDNIETRLGTLTFFDGEPDKETVKKVSLRDDSRDGGGRTKFGTRVEKARMREYKIKQLSCLIPSPQPSRQLLHALPYRLHPCKRPGGRGS